MKKFFILTAAVLLLTSCGGNGGEVNAATLTGAPTEASGGQADENETEPVSDGTAVNGDGFIFVYGGENVYMDEDMTSVLERIGAPKNTFVAPSCAFAGDDKVFSYSGADILTYPKDGADFVHTINYMDDSITTPEGIRLGDSLADVTAAYGEDYTEDMGQYTYVKGATYLRFLLKDDMVISITYGLTEYMAQI